MATSRSPLCQQIHSTTLAFLQSHQDAHTSKDVKHLSKTLAPDARRYMSPVSLLDMLPPHFADGESNEHYEARMQVELDTTDMTREPEIRYLVIDEFAQQAVLNAIVYIALKHNGKEFPFEFVWKLNFTEDGREIKAVREYVDTVLAKQFLEESQGISEIVMGTKGDSA